jgi:hypothetical protein
MAALIVVLDNTYVSRKLQGGATCPNLNTPGLHLGEGGVTGKYIPVYNIVHVSVILQGKNDYQYYITTASPPPREDVP